MPIENLRAALSRTFGDRKITSAEADEIAKLVQEDGGTSAEEAVEVRSMLARMSTAFEPGSYTRLSTLLTAPRPPVTPVDPAPVTPVPVTPAPVTPAPISNLKDLADPSVLTKHEGSASYQWKPGGVLFVDGADELDVIQGQIADCYMVSAFAAVAAQSPEVIKNAITDNGDGTYTVKLLEPSNYGAEPTPVEVVVDGQLTSSYAKSATGTELWVGLLEKAFAQHKGGYEAIGNGGDPGYVMSALTGRDDRYTQLSTSADATVFEALKQALANGESAVACTYGKDRAELYSGSGLYAWHAYTVLAVSEENGEQLVTLRNPWGKSEPGADGQNDGVFKLSVADYRKYYSAMWIA